MQAFCCKLITSEAVLQTVYTYIYVCQKDGITISVYVYMVQRTFGVVNVDDQVLPFCCVVLFIPSCDLKTKVY